MNFEMTEDRRMLADSLARFLADKCPVEARVDVAYAEPWFSRDAWQGMKDLGVMHALVDETHGGFGGAGFDIAVIFETIGQALSPEPVLANLLATQIYAHTSGVPEWLLSGAQDASVAIGELDAPYDLDGITTQATETPDGLTISGRKSVVYTGSDAATILVAARHGGALGVYEVAAKDANIVPYGMIDGGPAAEIIFDLSPARALPGNAPKALQTALDAGALALSAEALGAMQRVVDTVTDYLKTRTQFGQPLGAFQALQHRAVDLLIDIEQARSSVILAAAAFATPDQSYRASQAKHLVGKIARNIAEEAIQLHGGIGITWEYPMAHYAKRLVMIDHQLGDTDHHLERLMHHLTDA